MKRNKETEIPGTKYGRWTVLGPGDLGRKFTSLFCECDCGNRKSVYKYNLISGISRSCGCIRSDAARSKKKKFSLCESEFRSQYRSYKKCAKKRKIQFSLSEEEFILVASKDCIYCGLEPTERQAQQTIDGPLSGYFSNGIDRVDNGKGYIIGNVAPCCAFCNIAKGRKSAEEFINSCKRVAGHNI